MVIIWLMMMLITIWLVVAANPSEKYDGVSSSVGKDEISPYMEKSKNSMVPKHQPVIRSFHDAKTCSLSLENPRGLAIGLVRSNAGNIIERRGMDSSKPRLMLEDRSVF